MLCSALHCLFIALAATTLTSGHGLKSMCLASIDTRLDIIVVQVVFVDQCVRVVSVRSELPSICSLKGIESNEYKSISAQCDTMTSDLLHKEQELTRWWHRNQG